ncbi:hypothetical protein A2U01_0002665 [Trifolium medium]|uniref:Endonuclease/exonuclease/phosphatase domain-containing protein n=1 Tax=Trifolium medium TaxID=97028 RepID=A0A392M3E0_9FABA|nr:hypothetical protein [Trifolium medium]
MKLISYNIRGLGGKAKKSDIRKLISNKSPDLISIQETKLENVDRRLCATLWGSGDFDFVYKESEGRSGGLITIWDVNSFKLNSVVELNYAQLMEGVWKKDNVQVIIVNIYAPCDLRNKVECWDEILKALAPFKGGLFCIMGDFNCIRSESERKGAEGRYRNSEMDAFNNFILNGEFVDLPMAGKRFTWWRSNGLSMSRLDRFLLSEDWMDRLWIGAQNPLGCSNVGGT